MSVALKWLLILTLTGTHAQEPRKRNANGHLSIEEPFILEQSEDDVSCSVGSCVKRSQGHDEFGPFWANRGKKDPTYTRSKLFVEEPRWILVRRDDKDMNDNEPFYVTRGKKKYEDNVKLYWRNLFGDLHRKVNLGDVSYILKPLRKGHANSERSVDFQ